ncbi:alpha/beta hydrolase [Nocardia vinacea]|uniref:Alpha/beta hydrolase n=1 Tax=Nocardia vinacea TaxID=96468 RepID=A0ABZ1YP36_9NOCA|nr:alpha/beta hydrolase [Nocardia vinacea]
MTSTDVAGSPIRMRSRLNGQLLFWFSKGMARVLAPHYDTMEGLQSAIRKDRARGPARPPKRLLRKLVVREELHDDMLVFRVSPRGGATNKKLQLLYLHGGAFVLDLQRIQWNLVARLLAEVDADMTIPIYPLGPEATWQQTMAAVEKVYLDLANEHGASNVVVTGDSAGGGLSLLLAQAMRDNEKPMPNALVLFSPIFDLSASGEDQPALERRDPSLSLSLVKNAFDLWAPSMSPQDPRISPLFADHANLPPTIVFSGDREILDSDARRLKEVNPAIQHLSYAEMAHVFPIGGTREGTHAMREAAAFIKASTQQG